MHVMESDPVVKKYLKPVTDSGETWCSKAEHRLPPGWAIEETQHNEFVGRADLTDPIDPELWQYYADPELSIVLAQAAWRLSIGSKVARILLDAAFELASYPFVKAVVHPNNIGSLHLIKKLGFEPDGIHYCDDWRNGHERHVLRPDRWLAARRRF